MLTVGRRNEATRVAWIEAALKQVPAGWRILDAGAGECQFRKFCSHLRYVAQDLARYDGKGDAAGFQTGSWDTSRVEIISDITSIPEPDASFDAILCTEVLEHIPQPVLAVREFARLLRPGGHLILTAPFCSVTHFAPFHFSTGFSRYFYEKALGDHGFDILEMTANGNCFEFTAQELERSVSVARRYANEQPAWYERWVIRFALRMLQRFSDQDKDSSEMLCHGYHVRAVKARPDSTGDDH